MKFFWRIFFSIITVTTITLSLGSYLMISLPFNTSLEREVQASFDENDMLRTSLHIAANNEPHNGNLSDETLKKLTQSLKINAPTGSLQIDIKDTKYDTLYSNSNIKSDNTILKSLTSGLRGYEIIKYNNKKYIKTACAEEIGGKVLFLSSYREITSIYTSKAEQFNIVQKLMLALILINGILILAISLWLTYPIKKLSRATKLMAKGNFAKRVKIQSNNEIGMLSEDFNIMADKLEKNITDLKEASERQEHFIGSFAHELKTPLTSMIGYADMLRSKKMSEEQNFMAANYIFQEGKRLEALSLKLMDMIVLKKQDFIMKRINSTELLEGVQGLVKPVLENKDIKLILSVEDCIIYVEPDLIKSVCINLIDNAKKAMEHGGEINLTGKKFLNGYTISIRDTGMGIPKEDLSKITEAFYMVDKSRSRASGGAGLGLAICSEIIKLHNGDMRFESEIGKGTTVTIFLKDGET